MLPIVPTTLDLTAENPVIPLSKFAQLTMHTEYQFFGVHDDNAYQYQCNRYWTKTMRDWVNYYLNLAQSLMENELNFTLSPRWITNEQFPIRNSRKYHTRWGYIIEPGIEAIANVSLGETVEYGEEPAKIGPIATTLTATSEIQVFHPGTDDPIVASNVVIANGFLTIYIPKARLVTAAAMVNTVVNGIMPDDNSNFEAEVDIKRIYNDPSTQAIFTKIQGDCATPPCSEEDVTGCITFLNKTTGHALVNMATYSSGAWIANTAAECQSGYYKVFLNYKTGWLPSNINVIHPLMQLAMSLLPDPPCSCSWIQQYWTNARQVPEDAEYDNPFGEGSGAELAWRWVHRTRYLRGGVI